jgi:GNAT superfamily N-acetyltransferase
MNTRIRSYYPGDAEAVCNMLCRSITACCVEDHHNDPVRLQAWLNNKTPENIRTWFQASGAISAVAVSENKIVGCALCSISGEIMLCYLAPEALFIGLGKSLLAAIEQQAVAAGITQLFLGSTRTAREFYLRNGFSPSGPAALSCRMEYYPMSKVLLKNIQFL